jgi:hypothetical protein
MKRLFEKSFRQIKEEMKEKRCFF